MEYFHSEFCGMFPDLYDLLQSEFRAQRPEGLSVRGYLRSVHNHVLVDIGNNRTVYVRYGRIGRCQLSGQYVDMFDRRICRAVARIDPGLTR